MFFVPNRFRLSAACYLVFLPKVSISASVCVDMAQMKEGKNGTRTGRFSKSTSADPYPLVLDIDDFKVTSYEVACLLVPLIGFYQAC